jgi:hypothetical protein
MKFAVIVCLCGVALASVGCADGQGAPTGPSATAAVPGLGATAASSSAAVRSGDLHVTKECSEYRGLAGQFCTITSSNIKEIEVGSRVVYAKPAGATGLDTDVVLDTPGPGNNKAFGHCALDGRTGLGLCTFAGGTGKFTWFSATAHVSPPSGVGDDWHWEGTYSFSPQ